MAIVKKIKIAISSATICYFSFLVKINFLVFTVCSH